MDVCNGITRYCHNASGCPKPVTENTLGDVGVTLKLGQCSDPGPQLDIVSPGFTTRTRLPGGQLINDPYPNQCQPFDVVWSACNHGSVTTAPTSYVVRLTDQVPPGVVGLDQGFGYSAPALAPCACDTQAFVSSGLHCNEPAITRFSTRITTTLGARPPTGMFTVEP